MMLLYQSVLPADRPYSKDAISTVMDPQPSFNWPWA